MPFSSALAAQPRARKLCKRSAQRRRCDGTAGVAKPEEPSVPAHGRSEGVRD